MHALTHVWISPDATAVELYGALFAQLTGGCAQAYLLSLSRGLKNERRKLLPLWMYADIPRSISSFFFGMYNVYIGYMHMNRARAPPML